MTGFHGPPPALLVGLDVGSTAIKVVAQHADTSAIVWIDYQRHESRPAEKLLEMLTRLETETGASPATFQAFITGSGGAPLADIVGARHVQEVAALAVAAGAREPHAHSLIELGGQDAKIVLLDDEGGRTRKTVSMNDKCAGGTGAVLDKLSAKLRIPADAVGGLRYSGLKIYPIAGKCGVFAETDLNGLQKRGVPTDELMASLFDAIVLQNLAVLLRGHTLRPTVLLLGGPNAFIRGLREAWATHIARVWRERGTDLPAGATLETLVIAPSYAAHFPALGAVALGRRDPESARAYQGARALAGVVAQSRHTTQRRGVAGLAGSGCDLEWFRRQYGTPSWQPVTAGPGDIVRGFIGLDAGSTSTKAVLIDEQGEVLAKSYQLSRGNPIEDGIDMFRALRAQVEGSGARIEPLGLVTTGYAKDILKDVFCADAALVETVAHAQSALQLYEDPHVIVDVGGQDIKIIVLNNGRVKDFRLNTQCSAGNGYFLQAISQSFGIPVEEFAERAFTALEMPSFGYGCVLFLQSEIANVQRHGWRPEEVLAGLAAVLPKNVFLYVAGAPNLARLGTRFVLQGGTQRNLAAVKAQVDFITENFRGQDRRPEIVLHRHSGEAGAIGAALEGVRLWREGRATSFIGFDAAERIQYRTWCDETTRCHFCTNDCLRTFIDVWTAPEGGAQPASPEAADASTARRLIVANCEKGSTENLGEMRQIKAALDAARAHTPNLVALSSREVWKSRRPPPVADSASPRAFTAAGRRRRALCLDRARVRVGIPRVFNMYAYAPLFSAYLESLGVLPHHIVYSDYTSTELYKAGSTRGAIDPCFPSKVALAHVHNLLHVKHPRTALDYVFFPMIDVLPSRLVATKGSNACPTVALTPQTVRAAFTKDEDVFATLGVRYLDPLLNLDDRRLFVREMLAVWGPILGLSWHENERAVEAGFAALAEFDHRIRKAAREALDALEAEDRVGVVLLGRVYHHDPGLNHGIAEELQKLGYPVFSQSTLPLDDDLLERLFGDEVRAGVIGHPLDISDVWKQSTSASSNHKLWAAKFAARHPNLVAVELSNFKCGHDAPIYSAVEEIIESSGTPYFAFKDLDENRPAGSIKLRLETLDYALRRYRERLVRHRRVAARIDRLVAVYEQKLREHLEGVQQDGAEAREPSDAVVAAT